MESKATFGATNATTLIFGILAGIGGLVHGIGEVLQGNVRPDGIIIESWTQGPIATNMGGEPGMTIVPNLLVTGILTILVSITIIIWAARAHGKHKGSVLLLLSVAMMLVGGGFGPPIIGMLAGLTSMGTAAPRWRFLGTLWPWVFAIAVANGVFLVVGSLILVYVFDVNNPDLFVQSFFFAVVSLLATLLAGRAHDAQNDVQLVSA